ncbi:MAG: glutamate racemase [Candidatus Limnocylindrus sp.]|jgi:glutamate racemase
MPDSRPIGFFDSGVGGLTVLRAAQARLPGESTIYIGDTARHPYGTRTDAEVLAFSEELTDALVARDVKSIVIACNTATSVALSHLRLRHPEIPFIGVVRPGAAAATLATRTGRIGVIATEATVRSGAYFAAIKDQNPAVRVLTRAASELVPLIEAGDLDGAALRVALDEVLAPFRATESGPRVDTLLLGCTHFPLIKRLIATALGESIAVVDSAAATAATLQEVISVNHLDAPGSTRGTAADPGSAGHSAPDRAAVRPAHQLFTTGDLETFRALAERLFGEQGPEVTALLPPRR